MAFQLSRLSVSRFGLKRRGIPVVSRKRNVYFAIGKSNFNVMLLRELKTSYCRVYFSMLSAAKDDHR
jgi:hypothetical protein